MKIGELCLVDYRSYSRIVLTPPAGPVILEGSNGAGKTNLLEAIRLLTILSPYRGGDAGAVRRAPDAPRPGWRVSGRGEGESIDVVYRLGPPSTKEAFLDGRRVERLLEAVGRLRTALFAPEDIEVVEGPPEARRRFIDQAVAQVDPAGLRALAEFRRVARRRARALRDHMTGRASEAAVRAWDEPLRAAAGPAAAARERLAEALSGPARRIGAALFGAPLDVALEAGGPIGFGEDLRPTGGPGRDDLMLSLGGRDLRDRASRGERRAAASVLRLAEADVVASAAGGARPVVLVDDVCGELDPRRRAAFLEAAGAAGDQVFVAATDAAAVRPSLPEAVTIRIPEDIV